MAPFLAKGCRYYPSHKERALLFSSAPTIESYCFFCFTFAPTIVVEILSNGNAIS